MDPKFDWQTNHYRARQAITANVNEAIRVSPLDRIVFFTLTFRPHLTDTCQSPFVHASKCYSKAKRLLNQVFSGYLSVLDVHGSGWPHFHGIAITHTPIREGFDEAAYDTYVEQTNSAERSDQAPLSMREVRQLRDNVSSNINLRSIWQLLDEKLPSYGFGPMIGVFPLRKVPKHARMDADADVDKPEFMTSAVASYLARAYVRAIPAVKRINCRVRIPRVSKDFPSKIKVADIKNPKWLEAKHTLATLLKIDPETGFAEKIGQPWGLYVSDLVDALDASLENDRGREEWRKRGEEPWLALSVKSLIEQDRSFAVFSQFMPRLEEMCRGYTPTPHDPQLRGFEPLLPSDE